MDKEYRVPNNFHKEEVSRTFDYPKGTPFKNLKNNGYLYDENGNFMCCTFSELARIFNLVGNDDGRWEERGPLVIEIKAFIQYEKHEEFENRVEPLLIKMWEDEQFLKYNQFAKDGGPWIWNEDFYCAPIDELKEKVNNLRNRFTINEMSIILNIRREIIRKYNTQIERERLRNEYKRCKESL